MVVRIKYNFTNYLRQQHLSRENLHKEPSTVPGSRWIGSERGSLSPSPWPIRTPSQLSHNAFPRAPPPEPPLRSHRLPLRCCASLSPTALHSLTSLLGIGVGGMQEGDKEKEVETIPASLSLLKGIHRKSASLAKRLLL